MKIDVSSTGQMLGQADRKKKMPLTPSNTEHQ